MRRREPSLADLIARDLDRIFESEMATQLAFDHEIGIHSMPIAAAILRAEIDVQVMPSDDRMPRE